MAGSIESRSRFIRTVSVPPRWPAPDCRTLTRTFPPDERDALRPVSDGDPARDAGSCADRFARSVPSNWLLTQTPRESAATAVGPSPVGMTATTEFVVGSIRETVPSRLFATHAAPPPNATPAGPFPTGIVRDDTCPSPGRCARRGSASVSLAHSVSVAERELGRRDRDRLAGSAARGVDLRDRPVAGVRDPDRARRVGDPGGPLPTIDRLHDAVFVSGSIRETVPSRLLATQIEAASDRDPARAAADGIVSTTICLRRVDPRDGAVVGVRDPGGPLADGDAGRRRTDRHLRRRSCPSRSRSDPTAFASTLRARPIRPSHAERDDRDRDGGARPHRPARPRAGSPVAEPVAARRPSPLRGGNSVGSPSTSSWKIRSGRSMSFSRYDPRSRKTRLDARPRRARGSPRQQHLTAVRRPPRSAPRDEPPARRSPRPPRPALRCGSPSARAPPTPSGQACSASARWAATAASERRVRGAKAKKNASPCVSISASRASAASRRIRRCSASTSPYRSPSCLSSRVEPSMSVKRKVTVPLGSSATR